MALQEKFDEATNTMSKKINKTLTDEELKEVYGLYKQVKTWIPRSIKAPLWRRRINTLLKITFRPLWATWTLKNQECSTWSELSFSTITWEPKTHQPRRPHRHPDNQGHHQGILYPGAVPNGRPGRLWKVWARRRLSRSKLTTNHDSHLRILRHNKSMFLRAQRSTMVNILMILRYNRSMFFWAQLKYTISLRSTFMT